MKAQWVQVVGKSGLLDADVLCGSWIFLVCEVRARARNSAKLDVAREVVEAYFDAKRILSGMIELLTEWALSFAQKFAPHITVILLPVEVERKALFKANALARL